MLRIDPIRCDFGTTEEMNHVCYKNMWSIPMVSNRGLTSGSLLRPTDQWTNSLTDSISGPVFSTMLIDRGGYQAGLARMLLQWAHPARSQDRSGQGRHQTPPSPRAQANKQEEQACGASWWSAERAGDQNARWQAARTTTPFWSGELHRVRKPVDLLSVGGVLSSAAGAGGHRPPYLAAWLGPPDGKLG